MSGVRSSAPRGVQPRRRIVARAAGLITAVALSGCATAPSPADVAAARRNAQSLYSLKVDLFGRAETGWAFYAPRVEQTVGADTAADTARFAQAVSRWRRRRGGPADGALDEATLRQMKALWQAERPFVRLRARGVCPAPPLSEALALTSPEESAGGRAVQLRRDALRAYRRMVHAARREAPAIAARPELLAIFSGYRSPQRDAARCAAQGDCQGVVRAACSAHRTGLAVDLVLDAAPGYAADSTAYPNRLAMARGLAYRWLIANAPRFGFVNYAFEPWHWEWTGAAP